MDAVNQINVDLISKVIGNIYTILLDYAHHSPDNVYESILDIIAVKNNLRPAAMLSCAFRFKANNGTSLNNKVRSTVVHALKKELSKIGIIVYPYPFKGSQKFLNLIVTRKDNLDIITLITEKLYSRNITNKDFHIVTGQILGYLSPINIFNKNNHKSTPYNGRLYVKLRTPDDKVYSILHLSQLTNDSQLTYFEEYKRKLLDPTVMIMPNGYGIIDVTIDYKIFSRYQNGGNKTIKNKLRKRITSRKTKYRFTK